MADALENLRSALWDYNNEAASQSAAQALAAGTDPGQLLSIISDTMRSIGDAFATGELWLPDLIAAARAAQAATPVIEAELQRQGRQADYVGTVVVGTVLGDVHSIGKSMVGLFMASRGFKVIDVGENVPAERFIQAIRNNQADVVALSALLTTTAPEQGKVIKALEEAGLRQKVKVLVGGGAITEEFAQRIGADGYGATAPEAVALATQLLAG